VLATSLYFMLQVPGSFIPPEDVPRIPIGVELPSGSTLADTDVATAQMRDAISDIDGVGRVFVLGGSSPTGDLDIRRASVTVILDKLDHSLARKLADAARAIPVAGRLVPELAAEGRVRQQAEIEAWQLLRRS
jgi:multidrug efflux pump subunit AcrB